MPSIFRGTSRRFPTSIRRASFTRIILFGFAWLAAAGIAQAQTTGTAGSVLPFDNQQPTVTLTQALVTSGLFPSNGSGGSANGDTLGFIYPFAGGFAPSGSIDARGQTLGTATNAALFSLLGTAYGGNGSTTFALPDLGDRVEMGVGTGPGLTSRTLGGAIGNAAVTLLTTQIPSHVHSLPGGGFTGATGGGQPFDNVQPSLPLQRVIATSGVFPTSSGSTSGGSATFLGQVATFAGTFVPDGWTAADGRTLAISSNGALFAILGNQFGGDGVTTFALPDLRGRVSVGADATHPVGLVFGQEATLMTTATMPAHAHTISGGGFTGVTGSNAPLDNRQPSLALNYIIAINGIYPSTSSGGGFNAFDPVLGQVTEFAGNFVPDGWALADGSLLPIATNAALYSLIGTQYGGDGITTFALPDLRGRTLTGVSATSFVGMVAGSASTTLLESNLPAHSHSYTVAAPTITSATYDAATGMLAVTGTNLIANAGGLDIVASKLTLTGEGGFTYTLTDTADVDIASATTFSLTLSANDRAFLSPILNRNGTASTGGTTYNLAAAEDWDTGAAPAAVIADPSGNGITVSNVAVPAITSATYNAATGALAVTGSGLLSLSGASNDIVANRLTLTGEGGATYTLTDTANVEITSGTAFTVALSATDRTAVNGILNKNGTSSTSGTTYNLAAAEDWAAGADAAVVVADTTGNGITVANVAVPTITSATYNAATGALTVVGSGFLSLSGAANDIVANKLTIAGEGGSTYTLTDTANVEITSGTTFTVFLSATDRSAVSAILNKNGTSSTSGTTYNVAAAEDWAAGADAAVVVADTTGNGIAVANVAVPTITSATYNAATGALTVVGSGFLSLSGAANDIVANKLTIAGEGGATYTLTDTANVEITSGTAFTLSLSTTDRTNVKGILNKNGTSSVGGTTYNLAAAEDWAAGADPAVVVADTTGNSITVSNVAAPAITGATYDAATGVLTVTGSGLLATSGAANDIVASKLTLTGEGGALYTLTDTANVEITSTTAFAMILSATDRSAVNLILNKDGLGSTNGTAYNLAAADDWDAGADATANIADITGNAVVVSNVAVPTITSATYDAGTGVLSVTGTGFLVASGATNDIVASKMTFTGKAGATYTLTDTANAEIASGTAFTLTLSATDKAGVIGILDRNGTAASDGTVYNLAAAEDWAAGADAAVAVADTTGNGITVSGVAPPVVTFTVTPSAGPNGTIAPATPQTVVAGAAAAFTVTPSAGYSATVGGSCGGTLTGSTYTTNPINASCSVTASFTAIPVTTFSGPSPTGSGTITASFTGGGAACGFATSAFIPLVGAPRSPPAGSAPANVSFPHGLFDFTLSGCTAGGTVSFTIVYPQPLPAGTAYWKYGPTPARASPHWYQLPASVGGNTVTFSITDGATGDDDLAANGAIVDQGGPGAPGAPGAPVPVPTLSEWALMLLASLVVLGGMRGLRRGA